MPASERLSREARAFLLTAGDASTDDALRASIRAPFDWSVFHAHVLLADAAVVVCARLHDLGIEPPPETADALARLALVTEFRQNRLEQRLFDSLDALERAAIPVVLLKGAASAVSAFGDFRMRPMGDLDLLVAPHHAERARVALLDAGWIWDRERYPQAMYDRHHHLPQLDDARHPGLRVEIHTGLFLPRHPFDLAADAVIGRSRTVEYRERTLCVPDPLDQMLIAAIHFTWSDIMSRGLWRTLRDVVSLSHDPAFAWDAFAERALAARAGLCAYWTLRLARELAGLRVPDGVRSALHPALPSPLLRILETHFTLLSVPGTEPCPSVALRRTLWQVGLQRRARAPDEVRPWDHEEDFVSEELVLDNPSVLQRVRAQLSRPALWWRWLRRVVPAAW
jgi:hypothetical protein